MTSHEIIHHVSSRLDGVLFEEDEDNGRLYNAVDDLVPSHLTNEQAADIYATIVESSSYGRSSIERAVKRNV